jgi:hypothetical protein
MKLSRRGFAIFALKATMIPIFATTLLMTGCNAVSDLETWIPVALTAVSQIVKLLGPVIPAPVGAAIALIQAAFAALLTTIQNYKKGTSVLSDIANGIVAVESAFSSFFASLSVNSTLLATIEGLAAIIISTIQAFAGEIGPAPPATFAINGKAVPVTPIKRSVKQFTADWNAECVKQSVPQAEI